MWVADSTTLTAHLVLRKVVEHPLWGADGDEIAVVSIPTVVYRPDRGVIWSVNVTTGAAQQQTCHAILPCTEAKPSAPVTPTSRPTRASDSHAKGMVY